MAITKATASSIAPAAKGDLVVGSATNDAAVLGVGSNDQVLTADSSTTTGLKWATASSGGMTLISETSASSVSSISFSSISGSYKQLYMVWGGILHSDNSSAFDIRLNNDSNGIYGVSMNAIGGLNIEARFNLATSVTGAAAYPAFGYAANNNALRLMVSGYIVIDNYASATKSKSFYGTSNFYNNNTPQFSSLLNYSGVFNSTSAITSVDIFRLSGTGTFTNTNNTTIRLYGVA